MSVVHKNLTRTPADAAAWFLRIDDGSTYGPVALGELVAWARQGRIEPENEVSPDGETWVPACNVDAFAMDWEVLLPGGGLYGPVCRETIPELITNGILSEDMTARKRKTGEQLSLGALVSDLADEGQAELALAPGIGTATPRAAQSPPQQPVSPAAEPEDERPEATALDAVEAPPPEAVSEADIDDTAAVALDTREPAKAPRNDQPPAPVKPPPPPPHTTLPGDAIAQRLEMLQQSARQARAQLSDARRELMAQKAETTAMQDQLRKVEEDARAADKAREQSEHESLEQQERATAAESELENARAQLRQLQDHYDRLQVESQQQFESLDKVRAELVQLEQRSKQEAAAINDRLQAKTAVLTRALRCILADPEVERGAVPSELDADPHTAARIEQLSDHLEQTRAALNAERERTATLESTVKHLERRPWQTLGIVLAIAAAIGLAAGLGYLLGNRTPARPGAVAAPAGEHAADAAAAAAGAGTEDAEDAEDADVATEQVAMPRPPPPRMPTPPPPAEDLSPVPAGVDTEPVVAATSGAVWPTLKIPRARITPEAKTCTIVFDYGLFSSSTELSAQAQQDLDILAPQLKPWLDRFSVVVEGHTDAIPVASGQGRYFDNFALGMARADVVVRLLQSRYGFPLNSIFPTSAGESDPPFANDSDESRRKNRTVVIKLTPRR